MLGPLSSKQNVGHISATFCHLHLITGRKMKCERKVPLHVTWFWKWSALTDGLLPTSGRRLLKQSPNWSSSFYWGSGVPIHSSLDPATRGTPLLCGSDPIPPPSKASNAPPPFLRGKADVFPMALRPCMIWPQVSSPTSSSHTGLIAIPGKHQDWMECLSSG